MEWLTVQWQTFLQTEFPCCGKSDVRTSSDQLGQGLEGFAVAGAAGRQGICQSRLFACSAKLFAVCPVTLKTLALAYAVEVAVVDVWAACHDARHVASVC